MLLATDKALGQPDRVPWDDLVIAGLRLTSFRYCLWLYAIDGLLHRKAPTNNYLGWERESCN